MSRWIARFINNVINLASSAFMGWVAIQAFRHGEDAYAAIGASLAIFWAVRLATEAQP